MPDPKTYKQHFENKHPKVSSISIQSRTLRLDKRVFPTRLFNSPVEVVIIAEDISFDCFDSGANSNAKNIRVSVPILKR